MGVIYPGVWQEERAEPEPASAPTPAKTWEDAAEDWWNDEPRTDRPSVSARGVAAFVVCAVIGAGMWWGAWRLMLLAVEHWPW